MWGKKTLIGLMMVFGLTILLLVGCSNTPTSTPQSEAMKISNTTLSDGKVGVNYYAKLGASGGSGTYTWSISDGSLPDGLTLGTATGVINGTPKTAGTFNFTVKVSTGKNDLTQPLSLTVKPISTPLVISNPSLENGEVGLNYSKTLSASGGNGTYTWSISGGSLPDECIMDPTYGQISGTPTKAGTFSFTVKATDTLGAFATRDVSITIK
jgi:hypothetical protein